MTEIVVDIIPVGILNKEILIPLGHWMQLRDMGNHMKAISHFTGLFYQDKSVIAYLWPLRSNAMQIPTFGKELTAHGIGRDNNLSLLIMLHEIP